LEAIEVVIARFRGIKVKTEVNKNRIVTVLSSIVFMALITACSATESTGLGITTPSEEPSSQSESEASEPSTETTTSDWTKFVTADLEEFSVSNNSCSYSDGSLEILVVLTNVSGKKILAVDASATVNDIFGEEIIVFDISEDKSFGPGKKLKVGSWGNSCYSLSDYSSEERRLMEMEDLEATTDLVIKVEKIAFEGGEILEF
jgi:hypothetical protein